MRKLFFLPALILWILAGCQPKSELNPNYALEI